jgi:hypothetical protein
MHWRAVNWWKWAFFVALLAFEGAREVAVLSATALPNFAIGTPHIYRTADGSFVSADGRWQRTDGGGAMVPTAISIECEREIGSCIMANTKVLDGYITMPDIDRHKAAFTDTGAEFTDDWPICDKLFVRIDAVHNQATAVRSSKHSTDPMCKGHDPEIQLRLGGFEQGEIEAWRKKHFVPLLEVISGISRLGQ